VQTFRGFFIAKILIIKEPFMKISGAEIIIKSLKKHSVDTVVGIPGGSNLPIYDKLAKSGITHILARHEQGAGFIAQGMARSTGSPAVVFATSGPGVMNLLTAIADAKMDSVPLIAITGQVPTSLLGTEAFQEVDTYGLTFPITKHSFLVKKADELENTIHRAFQVATSGRPGPVVIDVPKDVQLQEGVYRDGVFDRQVMDYIPEHLDIAIDRINKAQRPIIYAGGGVVASGAFNQLLQFSEKAGIPVAVSLMGLGSYPSDSPLYLGLIGMHGNASSNILMEEADLIICIGARFGDRTTGKISKFGRNSYIIHIDIENSDAEKIRRDRLSIKGDAARMLSFMLPLVKEKRERPWLDYVKKMKEKYDTVTEYLPSHPVSIIKRIASSAPKDAIITTDVGQHQMWVARTYPFAVGRTFLTSGGLGTMGFGLPAAIGAAYANPDKEVICFSGDGSLLMNIQELATLAELNLNVKIVLFDNGGYGLVRQQQELFYNKNYFASRFNHFADFETIARGFGIKSFCCNRWDGFSFAPEDYFNSEGPLIISIKMDKEYNVYPMVPPGDENINMLLESNA